MADKPKERSNSVSSNATDQTSRKSDRNITRKKDYKGGEEGEAMKQMLNTLFKEMKEMRKDMKIGNEEIKKTMQESNQEIRKMIEETRTQIAELKEKQEDWEQEKEAIKLQLKIKEEQHQEELETRKLLEDRIMQLEIKEEREEKEARKNNILIKGKKFDQENLKEEVKAFIKDELNIDTEIVTAFTFTAGENNITNVKLEKWEQKLAILKTKNKLQSNSEKIFIDNDLTIRERKIQAEIKKKAKEEEEKGKKTKIAYQKIRINNEWFRWDKIENKIGEKIVLKESKN